MSIIKKKKKTEIVWRLLLELIVHIMLYWRSWNQEYINNTIIYIVYKEVHIL